MGDFILIEENSENTYPFSVQPGHDISSTTISMLQHYQYTLTGVPELNLEYIPGELKL